MKFLILPFVVLSFLASSCSKETQNEKTEVELNSIKRSLEATSNRIEETVCDTLTGEYKAECLAKKIKNSAIESKDVIIDKAKEVKNKVD